MTAPVNSAPGRSRRTPRRCFYRALAVVFRDQFRPQAARHERRPCAKRRICLRRGRVRTRWSTDTATRGRTTSALFGDRHDRWPRMFARGAARTGQTRSDSRRSDRLGWRDTAALLAHAYVPCAADSPALVHFYHGARAKNRALTALRHLREVRFSHSPHSRRLALRDLDLAAEHAAHYVLRQERRRDALPGSHRPAAGRKRAPATYPEPVRTPA